MKKAILFLGLLGGLTSCDKLFDDTPKCDDKEVLELVEEIGIPKENFWWNIHREYYADKLEQYEKEVEKKEQLIYEQIAKKYGLSLWQVQNTNDLSNYLSIDSNGREYGELPHFWNEMKEELQNKMDILYDEKSKQYDERIEYLKANYQADEKIKAIYDKYYAVKVSNIRPISSDKESKKCECEATLNLGSSLKDNIKEVYYTAQKNTDGQIYVELFNL